MTASLLLSENLGSIVVITINSYFDKLVSKSILIYPFTPKGKGAIEW